MESIEPRSAGEIQHAQPEELTAMTNQVLEADKSLQQCNQELDLLNDALKHFSITRDEYDKKAGEVRKRMQRIATRL